MDDNKLMFAIIASAFIIGSFLYLSDNKIEEQKAEVMEVIPVSDCIDFLDAHDYIGEDTCVIGKIDHIFISDSGTVFFDYCKDYKTCPFVSVVFASDSDNFDNIRQYEGKTLEISGEIKTYKGQAEIILENEEQINIVN